MVSGRRHSIENVSNGVRWFWEGALRDVSDGLWKVSDGIVKVLVGIRKVSDGLVIVSNGLGRLSVGLQKVTNPGMCQRGLGEFQLPVGRCETIPGRFKMVIGSLEVVRLFWVKLSYCLRRVASSLGKVSNSL